MTKTEKLEKIIELAVERGWPRQDVPPGASWYLFNDEGGWEVLLFEWHEPETSTDISKEYRPGITIFTHDFLKAYFGEEITEYKGEDGQTLEDTDSYVYTKDYYNPYMLEAWKMHGQKLVLAEDRIEYLWENQEQCVR